MDQQEASGVELAPTRAISAIIPSGELDELNRLMMVYHPYLRVMAARMVPGHLRSRFDGSDLVQETLLRAVKQIAQFTGKTDGEFAAWLKQILQNLLIDWVRYHSADKRDVGRETASDYKLVAQVASPGCSLTSFEAMQRLSSAIAQLSEDQRLAVKLRSSGLSFEEVGQQMGRSADAARMVWGRSLARLLKILSANE